MKNQKLTKEQALASVSNKPAVAKEQTKQIELLYSCGIELTLNDIENIALDVHQAAMKKAMSY